MTKRDFEAIAKAFRQEMDYQAVAEDDERAALALRDVLVDLCKHFSTLNPAFDRRRFLFAATGSHDLHRSLIEREG